MQSEGITLSFDQERAVDAVLEWRHAWPHGKQQFICGGLGGTGKTTVINHLRTLLPNPAICAPTGKAASNLRTKGTRDASTIHSLIYRCETVDAKPMFTRLPSISAETIIVDEASCCDTKVMNDLLSFNVPILWVGDHGQLEPVGDNPWIMKYPDIKLEKIHRQAENNPILRLAMAFREGRDEQAWGAMRNGQWQAKDGRCTIINKRLMDQFVKDDMQIIVGFNNTRHALNKKIRKSIGYEGVVTEGEKMICLRNNAKFNVFNGQMLFVLAVECINSRTARVMVGTDDGEQISMPILLAQIGQNTIATHKDGGIVLADYGYAVTCHKFQGSEAESVAVIEEISESWDARRWRYTAASRARERLVYCV